MSLLDQLDNRPEKRVLMSYAPSGIKQKQYFNSWNVCNVIRGPVGSAKTTALVMKLWEAICDQALSPDGVRRSRWAVCRNTHMDLTRTILKEWIELIPDICGVYNSSEKTHTLRFKVEDGTIVESTVYFMALDTPKSIRSLLSMQLTGVVFNEVREHRRQTIFRALQRTARYPAQSSMPKIPKGDPKYLSYWDPKKHAAGLPNPRYWSGMLADSNAWDRDHYLEHIRRQNFKNWTFFDQPAGVEKIDGQWVINPHAENIENLSPEYYGNAMQGASESEIKVQLGNQMTVTVDGEPVHPLFDHERHVCETADYVPGVQVYAGFDSARNPSCVLTQPFEGGYQTFAEFPMFNTGLRRYFTELKAYLAMEFRLNPNDLKCVMDEAGNNRNESDESAIIIARDCGFVMMEPIISNKDHQGRRDTIDRHLNTIRYDGRESFLVHPRCTWLIGALEGKWYFKKIYSQAEDRFMAQPFKNQHSHTGEAAEYNFTQFGRGNTAVRPYKWRRPLPAMS